MQLINAQIILIELCIYLIISTKRQNNLIRFLSETNIVNSTINSNYSNDLTQIINSTNITDNFCNKYLDCFNCTKNLSCKWEKEKDLCIPFNTSNKNYSLAILYKDTNILNLNEHVNFIRKSCFMPFIPYIENNNYLNYNSNISLTYCGPHLIINNEISIKSDFKIEINNINGTYGTPNLLCEFIILTGPSFYVNIEINEDEINNFYLLYSKDYLNFVQYINSSISLYIDTGINKLNTFLFYGLKSFDKSPFIIKYKENNIVEKATEATGYIMIALGCVIIILLIFAIIFLRKKLIIFQKKEKKVISDDNEKLKNNCNKKKSDEILLKEKATNEQNSKYIYNFSPLTNTPTPFLNKAFQYNCSICNKMFDNNEEMKKAKCGHFYHIYCFDNLNEKKNNLKEKEIKCAVCQEIINL